MGRRYQKRGSVDDPVYTEWSGDKSGSIALVDDHGIDERSRHVDWFAIISEI